MPNIELPSVLAQLEARHEIADVLFRYCRGVDRLDLELFRSSYHPDAIDDHGLYKGDVEGLIDWIKGRHRNIVQSMHFVGNMLIDLDLEHDRAFMESYCTVTQRVSDVAGEPPTRGIQLGCRYLDRLERRAGRWAFASHVVAYEWWREFDVADVELDPECQMAARSPLDPLYGRLGLDENERTFADVRHNPGK